MSDSDDSDRLVLINDIVDLTKATRPHTHATPPMGDSDRRDDSDGLVLVEGRLESGKAASPTSVRPSPLRG